MATRRQSDNTYEPLGMELLEVSRPMHAMGSEFDGSSAVSHASNLTDHSRSEDAEQPLIRREGSLSLHSQTDGSTSDRPMVLRASRKKRYRFKSWKIGVAAAASMTTAVLFTNCCLTIWASVKFGLENGIETAIDGDCDIVSLWSFWLHIFINGLS